MAMPLYSQAVPFTCTLLERQSKYKEYSGSGHLVGTFSMAVDVEKTDYVRLEHVRTLKDTTTTTRHPKEELPKLNRYGLF
jgi:hypothetical protein